ncbi:uncharacterized protein LOC136085581 [Hydra vulgaris]|uniref:Uncharacterized protein LOC136085581 n=1 Tax=Hydra vulgaris TaxID=6087 RepID=A0ABM4CME7_HYDVU
MKIYFSVFFFAMCQSAKAQVERCTLFKDKFDKNRVLTQDWFKLSQLYSYCMYLKVENGQSSLSLFDEGCKTISCKECMKVCNFELPTNLTNCLLNCNVSIPCIFGCHFFFNITNNLEENDQNKPENTNSTDLILIQNQCLSVTFQWPNIFLKDSLVQSLYLITIKLMNKDNSTEYGLGLAIKNIFNIPDACFCYDPYNIFAYDLGVEFKWNVYLINYNGYNKSNKLSSNITKCSQFCVYKNTTRTPSNETQPVVILPKDFINYRKELTLKKGLYLETLNDMMNEYTVSFNLKPKSYSKGLKNVLHFILDNDIVENGDRNPGVWFHQDGSGKLVIFVAVNNNGKYSIETAPLTLNVWSFVKISQILSNDKYWLTVDLNGANIHRVENYMAKNFKNVKVYASDPWYDAQDGSIADLLIINGKVEYIVGNTPTPLVKGNIIAEIPTLDKEYLISFDVYPNNFVPYYHSVIHFTIGSNIDYYGDRTPGIWFHENGDGTLLVAAPINGYENYIFNTNPFKLNLWTNIEVSQLFKSTYYIYTIRINGDVVFSIINYQAQNFKSVKVYASDPWYEVQDGFIKNFFIVNGFSNSGTQPIVILLKDFINYQKELTLIKGLYLGTLKVMMNEYTISFNLKPKSYSKGLKNVLHFILDNDIVENGDQNPGVWFHEDGSGKLVIFVAVNNGNYSVETPPLTLDEWSFIMISQVLSNAKYWLTVDLNGVNIHRVENYNATNFKNVKVYASDPLYNSQNGSIADFLIINGKVEYIVGNTPTPLVKGNIIAEIPTLDKEYLISYDVYPNNFVPYYHSVIHFTIGSNIDYYGDRTPGIWFHENGDGTLLVAAPINGYENYIFNTNPFKLNSWTNIEVSQFLKTTYYLYTIRINGDVVFSVTNSQAQNFESVKVYASDPWYEVQDGFIKNFFIINGVSNSGTQPIVILPKDFINYRKEFTLAKGLYLGTLNVMMNEYTISFNLKPKSYSKGLKNVLRFTLENNIAEYGDRSSGVWFHEDGSGKLVVFVAVNNVNYSVETPPLALDEWSFVMISQILSNGKYWLTVDLNGVNIHRVENYNATNFKNVKVYASDLLYDTQNCSIADLLIINGKVEYIVGNTPTPLVKGNIIAEIPTLDKEYLISFDVYPNNFVPYYHSVIHFTIGSNIDYYGDRTPGIWFHKNGTLHIAAPINGYENYFFNTNPFKLNLWTNIEVSQFLKTTYYLYTIRINGDVIFSVINNQAQKFENVKVYASDPWYEVQDGFIKNFFIINGVSNSVTRPVVILPKDFINYGKEFTLAKGLYLGTLKVMMNEYTISFNLKPKSYSKGLKNALRFTLDNNIEEYGDQSSGVWFHKDGSGKLVIFVAVNNGNYSIETPPLTLDEWSFIMISQVLSNGKYWLTVDLNGVIYIEWKTSMQQTLKIVIHFTIGSDNANYGDRTPGIWFHENGNGALLVAAPINGFKSYIFNTNPFKLNLWTNIEVSQFLKSTYYIYTIRINGDVVFCVVNDQAQNFENVKVYASDPWYEVQDGFIKNFFIINRDSNSSLQPVIILSQPVITSSQPVIVSSAKSSIVVVAILVPVLISFVLFSIVFMLKIRRKRVKSFQSMWKKENFMVCKELSADEWEIFPEDITLDRKIGEGAFGTVYIAKIDTNIFSNTKNQNFKTQKSINSKVTLLDIKEKSANFFAVKLLKDSANQSEVDDFNEEINLMKGIGYHKNIVCMIGCSTIKKPLCLVIEFMENGDLLHFLRNRRNKLCSSKFGDESAMSFMYTQGFQQTLETTISESCTSGIMPHETPLDDNGAITPDDLLSFAWQIASGMEYLSFMKLVHRDLAARNILVGTEKNVKISDFGLTRKINDELNYMSSKNRRLPVKWMSVEAIFDQMFTTFSDVWAYGVVLFEIVTLGGTPYPSISNRELLTLLKSGYRMERPENCSEPMYDIMLRCWNEDPLQRPTFTELRDLLDKIMSCGDCYFDFSIDEKNNYYNAASFNSLPSESGDDALEENIFQKPVHVKSIKKISGETNEPLSERYTRDESSKLKIESTLSVGLVNCSANDMMSEI